MVRALMMQQSLDLFGVAALLTAENDFTVWGVYHVSPARAGWMRFVVIDQAKRPQFGTRVRPVQRVMPDAR